MIDACKASIARIYSHSGKSVIGAGFLVSETHLFSCTHIVTQALGIPENTAEAPTDAVYLDFPFVAGACTFCRLRSKSCVVFESNPKHAQSRLE